MELTGITWTGPAVEDPEILAELPEDLRGVLSTINGFILFGGALHVRGAVHEPDWHSLRACWRGPDALSTLFPAVAADDVPFAQHCVGDQFLLRDGIVVRLVAETGDVESLDLPLFEFLEHACADPVTVLSPQPLMQHRLDEGELAPGMLLHAYPPFCIKPSAAGVSLRAIPAGELIRAHADLARQLASVPDGTPVRMRAGE
jgi:hypothetical protein